jgi:hypothetical protein
MWKALKEREEKPRDLVQKFYTIKDENLEDIGEFDVPFTAKFI